MDGGICPVGSGRQPVVVAVFLAGEPLVLAGAGDALLVQLLGNTDLAHSVSNRVKMRRTTSAAGGSMTRRL